MRLKEDLFYKITTHLSEDEKPSAYFDGISSEQFFKEYPFKALYELKKTEQSPKHHPEGSVWNHTMMVIDVAATEKHKSKDAKAFMWAALLHDIGKPLATKNKNGKITSYDHDKLGAEMVRKFLAEFVDDGDFIEKVVCLVRWHMQILFVINNLPFGNIKAMKQQADINEVALLGFCDRMGRQGANKKEEENNIHLFLQKCKV